MEIILLHQTGPLVIDPRWKLLYYTRQAPCLCNLNGDYPTTPLLLMYPQIEITLLHQTGPLANLPQMEIAVLYQTGPF